MSKEGGGKDKIPSKESRCGADSSRLPDKILDSSEPVWPASSVHEKPRALSTEENISTQTTPHSSSVEGISDTGALAPPTLCVEEVSLSDRPVIAVSALKGPAAFFNLARKFLVTYDICDLSALEGAIVSAIDAAHLLERSRLAEIVRIQTSYVPVEPKRKKAATRGTLHSREAAKHKQHKVKTSAEPAFLETSTGDLQTHSSLTTAVLQSEVGSSVLRRSQSTKRRMTKTQEGKGKGKESRGKELRRARIIITVKRTEDYKQWLKENPSHDVSGDAEEAHSIMPK